MCSPHALGDLDDAAGSQQAKNCAMRNSAGNCLFFLDSRILDLSTPYLFVVRCQCLLRRSEFVALRSSDFGILEVQ